MPQHDFAAARTILILGLAPAIGLGMARFAYAIILPDMRTSLEWTYAEAGFMNTVNAAGYLAGALTGAAVVRRLEAYPTLIIGALACVAALLLSAATADFALLSIARAVAGIAAAFSFVAGGALAAAVSQRHPANASFLLMLFYTGPGVGFVLSGLTLPGLLEHAGPGSWWLGWAVLAALSAAATAILPLAGLLPEPTRIEGRRERLHLAAMAPFLAGYLIYGAGISAYLTFVVAWLAETGQPTGMQSTVWVAIGLGAVSAPWIWQSVIARASGGRATALIVGAATLGAAIPLATDNAATLVASAFVVGTSCFTVVAATTAFVRRNLPQPLWPAGIGVMTSCFGAGQVLGPVLAGAVTDQRGHLSAGLWCSVALLAAAIALTVLQRDLATAEVSDPRPGSEPRPRDS